MPNWSTRTACRSRRCTIRISSHTEIFNSVEDFYRRFYFRAPRSPRSSPKWSRSPEMMKRRLREGVEFFAVPARTAGSARTEATDRHGGRFRARARVNDAVEAAHRDGILTAASLMVGGAGGGRRG